MRRGAKVGNAGNLVEAGVRGGMRGRQYRGRKGGSDQESSLAQGFSLVIHLQNSYKRMSYSRGFDVFGSICLDGLRFLDSK